MQPDSSHDPDHHRGNIKATRSSFRASNAGPYGRVYTRRLDPKLKNWENVLKNALCNLMEPYVVYVSLNLCSIYSSEST